MLDLATIIPRLAYIGSEKGEQNECSLRTAALCAAAAIAALSIAVAAAWHPPLAHADGGASTRGKPSASAPDDSGATIQALARRILRAITDRRANNWVRYWQARAACDAAPDHSAPPRARALTAFTASLCAQLNALLNVNPAAHMPRREERAVGLLINEPDAAPGYTLFTGEWNNDVFLLDPLGRVAHAWRFDKPFKHAKLLDNGNLLTIRGANIFEFDPRGNLVWQYAVDLRIHHDFLKMPNGNVLLLVHELKTREEAIAAGANPEIVSEIGFIRDYLLEVRPTGANGGEIVWEWSAWDHLIQDFDPTKPNYGDVAKHPELIDINFLADAAKGYHHYPLRDWLHINSIDYNPELDQIMLSPRDYSELWIIDHSVTAEEARGDAGGNGGMGGDLLYRWGNPRAYKRGTHADQRLFWQHQTHWIPPGLPGAGNILLFNNGNEFPGYERYYSSIDEIVPPMDGYRYRRDPNSPYPPAEPAWTYAAETPADLYAPISSGAQRLPNGATLIVDGTAGTIFQTTPDGKIVWKYVVPLNTHFHLRQGERPAVSQTFPTPYGEVPHLTNAVYRAYWYPPDHPGLQPLDLTPGAYLEDTPDIYDIAHDAAIDGAFGEPIANSRFRIYLDENERRLIYIKQPCAAEDAQARFFLHITPSDARELPDHRREHGFDNLDFNFNGDETKTSGRRCIAMRDLPDYAIESIRAGQVADAGVLWRADINLNE